MNHSALKTFAQNARRKLLELVDARLDYVLTADTAELRQQATQVNELRTALKAEGREQLVDRVAYTWFNRLAALRFMDANGYHPFGARVITPATENETLPEILQQARAGALDPDLRASFANANELDDLVGGRVQVEHRETQIYRLLLVGVCNYYNRLMPFLFEKIGDATELLLPEDLITEHSIVADFSKNLTDEHYRDEEVLGWFYQYYISEKKDEVMGRDAAVPKQDIPAVTQLFTPHWIVRYLVENSLGRIWLLNRPKSKLREKMPYYIACEEGSEFLKITKPEDIRLLDPAGGSGHMLTYAFDLLYAIYEEEGYDAPEIPGLILQHNLYGVDICDRAVALAAFALCMKARSKDNRFFRRIVQPHVISLQEIRFEDGELSAYFKSLGTQPSTIYPELLKLLHQFEEAKNFGSLIQPCASETEIQTTRDKVAGLNAKLSIRDLAFALTHAKVLRLLEQAEYLCQRYQVVVANPPYMGSKFFNPRAKAFIEENYDGGRTDLYACFLARNLALTQKDGFIGMITLPGWLFLTSFEPLRRKLLETGSLVTLIDNGRGLWGSDFGSCAFVINKSLRPTVRGRFKRLYLQAGEVNSEEHLLQAFKDDGRFKWHNVASAEFRLIAGCPIAFWLSDQMRGSFARFPPLEKEAEPRKGMVTGDNPRFIRSWFEVAFGKIGRSVSTRTGAVRSNRKWFPYQKGGEFRRWYGNINNVVDWENDGKRLLGMKAEGYKNGSTNHNLDYIFREAVVWTKVTIAEPSFRFSPAGFLFDDASGLCVSRGRVPHEYILAFLGSRPGVEFLKIINPTVNTGPGNLAVLPLSESAGIPAVTNLATRAIELARTDWDNFETSWDFRDLPLLRPGTKGVTLAASWRNWKSHCDAAIHRMQELESENNRLFIAAYGLQNELTPEVPEDRITLARADARKDMAAFLSYAIGCMLGRYSLDLPGLILADAGGTVDQYVVKINRPFEQLTFKPDADGIIPVLDGEWFSDDIVGQLRAFLRITFGEATMQENVVFIEESMGKELRKYFTKEFYKDHLKTYKKRPIYWMFSSPEGSFQALIYLHRYNRDTVNLLLNDYVREFIGKLEERHRQLTAVTLNEAARGSERTKASKELSKIDKMLKEIRAWERDVILPLAQQRIELDLDDGVKVNYLKFKGAVVPIPGLEKEDSE